MSPEIKLLRECNEQLKQLKQLLEARPQRKYPIEIQLRAYEQIERNCHIIKELSDAQGTSN